MGKCLHLDRRVVLLAVLLARMTLAVSLHRIVQFININSVCIAANRMICREVYPRVIQASALTALKAANWHPVTWLLHMLDVTPSAITQQAPAPPAWSSSG